jgi:hypothetical protein
MDMSKAALPAKYGYASTQDEKHPLFSVYHQYRASMSALMVDSSNFSDWLFQYEQNLVGESAAKHKLYPEFMKWMKANQGGARRCPAGAFPNNMHYWINGGRW